MALPKSGGDGPHLFEKWWGRVPTVSTVRYAYVCMANSHTTTSICKRAKLSSSDANVTDNEILMKIDCIVCRIRQLMANIRLELSVCY